jgi:hypothetical protein
MDFWNTKIGDPVSTTVISKEIILTIFQCAARLYNDKIYAQKAVDLIESKETRAILKLGIQGILSQMIHQQCITDINKSNTTNTENFSYRADLFSTLRKNKARQLDYQAIVYDQILSLCRSHETVLQHAFASPKIDKELLFNTYVTLSKAFNHDEKSRLVTLFPDIFQWRGADLSSNYKGRSRIPKQDIMQNHQIICKTPTSPPHDPIVDQVQDGNNKIDIASDYLSSECLEYLQRLSQTPEEYSLLTSNTKTHRLGVEREARDCGDVEAQYQPSAAKNVNLPLRVAPEFTNPVNIKWVGGHKDLSNTLFYNNALDNGWDSLSSDDDIFPFSLGGCNEIESDKLDSTPLLRCKDINRQSILGEVDPIASTDTSFCREKSSFLPNLSRIQTENNILTKLPIIPKK